MKRPTRDATTDEKVFYVQRFAMLVTAPLYVLGFLLLLTVGLWGLLVILLGAGTLAHEFFRLTTSDGDVVPNRRL